MSDLIHKIVGKIIEAGQSDTTKFKLGEIIRYSPSEIMEILKQHENEIFGEESSTQPNTSNTLNALDTIYRQDAINIMMALQAEDDEAYGCHIPESFDGERAKEALEILPSAQPEPKKGKWIVHPEVKNVYGGTYIECSQCGEKYVVQHMEDEKYCRNCGAKMEV